MVLMFCSSSEAQELKKVPRIGYLALGSGLDVNPEAFPQGFRPARLIEGRNMWLDGAS